MAKPEREFGMDKEQVSVLAEYNSEVARGIVHTREWEAKMAHYQKIFDWHTKVYLGADPRELGPPPPPIYLSPAYEMRGLGTEWEWPIGKTGAYIAVIVLSFVAGDFSRKLGKFEFENLLLAIAQDFDRGFGIRWSL